jgi:hypothetical protein
LCQLVNPADSALTWVIGAYWNRSNNKAMSEQYSNLMDQAEDTWLNGSTGGGGPALHHHRLAAAGRLRLLHLITKNHRPNFFGKVLIQGELLKGPKHPFSGCLGPLLINTSRTIDYEFVVFGLNLGSEISRYSLAVIPVHLLNALRNTLGSENPTR